MEKIKMNLTDKNKTAFPQVVEIPSPLTIHPSVSALAAELLMKTADAIARTPREYDQGCGIVSNKCGTSCCIMGHMHIAMHGRPRETMGVYSWSGEAYGLTEKQAVVIYKANHWPAPFTQPSDTSIVAPDVAIARIEHFLTTGQ